MLRRPDAGDASGGDVNRDGLAVQAHGVDSRTVCQRVTGAVVHQQEGQGVHCIYPSFGLLAIATAYRHTWGRVKWLVSRACRNALP